MAFKVSIMMQAVDRKIGTHYPQRSKPMLLAQAEEEHARTAPERVRQFWQDAMDGLRKELDAAGCQTTEFLSKVNS
jgi:hypothetical protein